MDMYIDPSMLASLSRQQSYGRPSTVDSSLMNLEDEIEDLDQLMTVISHVDDDGRQKTATLSKGGADSFESPLNSSLTSQQEIHWYCMEGNYSKVEKELSKCIEQLEARTMKEDNTPLICAAKHGCYQTVRVLLTAGAQVDAVNKYGSCALYQAASMGHVDIVSLLILHGAQTDLCSDKGGTPLHAAVAGQHLEAARLLLLNGAAPDARDGWGVSALERALDAGHRPLAALLAACGASLGDRVTGDAGRMALVRAWGLLSRGGHARRLRADSLPHPPGEGPGGPSPLPGGGAAPGGGGGLFRRVAQPRPELSGVYKTKSVPDFDQIYEQHYELCLIEI